LLLVAFMLVNAPNCHLSLALASVVQGDAVNCNKSHKREDFFSVSGIYEANFKTKIAPLRSL